MPVTNALAGIAVNEIEAAIHWYSQLLGRGPDQRPMPNVAEWQFEKGGWIQIFEDEDRAGASSMTLVETDLDKRIADLKAKDIPIQSRTNSPKTRTAIIEDEDGNRIVFAQSMSAANPSTA